MATTRGRRVAKARPSAGKKRAKQVPIRPTAAREMPESNPEEKPFTPKVLDRTAIAIPLLEEMLAEEEAISAGKTIERKLYRVIIDVHLEYPDGRDGARRRIVDLVDGIVKEKGKAWKIDPATQGINSQKSDLSRQYLFGVFEGRVIRELIRRDLEAEDRKSPKRRRAIYRIWPDFKVKALLTKSISTVKADAALNSFGTTGDNIVWAVMDSGIDATHPHFDKYDNLNLTSLPPLAHRDFTTLQPDGLGPLIDRFGHGTHVAAIIAGEMSADDGRIEASTRYRDENGEIKEQVFHPKQISGMAPKCKLISLKVVDDAGEGEVSNLIAALEAVQQINGYGRYIRIHGVNMSIGYDFEPEWFACGQSPLCVEVDRLVKSGVVVVVAAGNSGYGSAQSEYQGVVSAGLGLTINDPGNAELALTVGSTHREMPHVYGVSYFSSKGPTGDGRLKPDVVAPGEKIVSAESIWTQGNKTHAMAAAANKAALATLRKKVERWQAPKGSPAGRTPGKARPTANYKEDSGTSMSAPHVSGVVAAFLSVRREFVGRPERVKEIFLSTATDLRRDRYFQGSGLVDLMRAIQSV